jgi:hypothetical protein
MNFIFFVSMISIPHKIKQARTSNQTFDCRCCLLFYYNQLANSDPRLGEVHYFIQEESVGSGIIFILLLSVLNLLEILKWQNLVSFYIKSPAEATKQVLAALTAGLFTQMVLGIRR